MEQPSSGAAASLAAGLGLEPSAVDALLRGVAAAPPPLDPDQWLDLFHPDGRAAVSADARRMLADRLGELRLAKASGPGVAERLQALRAELARCNLDGFIVPHGDRHMMEHVPTSGQRLEWLTGFTGSAGLAVVLAERAAIFVDGRYTLQVRDQVSEALFEPRHMVDEPVEAWLADAVSADQKLGYDPWLHTVGGVERLRAAVERSGAHLVPVSDNPVDAVWADRPADPIAPMVIHDLSHAGVRARDKQHDLARSLKEARQRAAVLTQSDAIAWLTNTRGGDVDNTPLTLSFAIVRVDGDDDAPPAVELYVDPRKLGTEVIRHLGNTVTVADIDRFADGLDRLKHVDGPVRVDPAVTPAWVFERLSKAGVTIDRGDDPTALAKARKNAVEIAGTRAAHVRDGVAVTRFLAWLDRVGPGGTVMESEAGAAITRFRSEMSGFRGESFSPIVGFGPNGAIVHYRVTPETDRRIVPGDMFLIDSGAQYVDGTTDITRTVAIGPPTDAMARHFTLVLKGHIALATLRFPAGTTGSQIDALARAPLWRAGLDFDHGTGHGVGSYLSVHEGPQRVSKMPNQVRLDPGMIISNEPGYYLTGAYGIRIENLLLVEADPDPAERPMCRFETLTLAPIDRRLIATDLLDDAERGWVDAYHARVLTTLAGQLDAADRAWLTAACAPL